MERNEDPFMADPNGVVTFLTTVPPTVSCTIFVSVFSGFLYLDLFSFSSDSTMVWEGFSSDKKNWGRIILNFFFYREFLLLLLMKPVASMLFL